MSSGVAFLEQHLRTLSTAGADRFLASHESFVRELASCSPDPTDGLSADQRAAYIAFFSQCQRRYLAMKEDEASEEILAANGAATFHGESMSNRFGRNAYERVRDLREMVQLRNGQTVVMVGCGAFPATLLWLRDHFPDADYTGIDLNAGCVERAARVAKVMGIANMRFEVMDGCHCDFEGVDFVYVANQVVPKKAVLQQIGRSSCVSHVVVREPTRRGELLAETVRYDLPEAFAIQDQGAESPTFLSYDLILRRA